MIVNLVNFLFYLIYLSTIITIAFQIKIIAINIAIIFFIHFM